MTIFLCGSAEVLEGACPECGGWLHRIRKGGFPDPGSLNVCSEECIDSAQTNRARAAQANHLRTRDMLCHCPEVCAPAGLPTAEELAEWAAYEADPKAYEAAWAAKRQHREGTR